MPLLSGIKGPSDLKKLSVEQLPALAAEIREKIVNTVSKTGGHLAPNLGVVELTIALHYVFDTPSDRIIWDTGHQSYVHKLLTGRQEGFENLRRAGGISGFPNSAESEYDVFETGHSSTSISAALGMAAARDLKGESHRVIAVIGDGALSGGMAFEALNNAGHQKRDLIVVLNDNEMSISPNVGAFSTYLNRIITGKRYNKAKEDFKRIVEKYPRWKKIILRVGKLTEEVLKGFFAPGVIFEELGFTYIEPVDGHNLPLLVETFRNVKNLRYSVLVHVVCKKGKGYQPAENNPSVFHSTGPFKIENGITSPPAKAYSHVFGETLVELAKSNRKIVAVSAAMTSGTGLDAFSEKFPGRFFDVGIAEQHAVTFAAGLAKEGIKPVVAIYSTFFQRAFDQVLHDVCRQKLPVVFALDRAGIVSGDGPTHQGLFDISYLRGIPGLVFMAPANAEELKEMLKFAVKLDGPAVIRYPREEAVFTGYACHIEPGKAELKISGSGGPAIFACGTLLNEALKAAEKLKNKNISASVVNLRFIKPLDGEMIAGVAEKADKIITIEDGILSGGAGTAVSEVLLAKKIKKEMICLGINEQFGETGERKDLLKKYGLDADGIIKAAGY